jgi:hypothetical protein
MEKIIAVLLIAVSISSFGQTKVLFDASKAQMAANADWIIDADQRNISCTTGPAVVGSGTESNPQRFPTPAQSGITATTAENFWSGALSAWAVDCAKLGYVVETLPYNGLITYGINTNPQDLSNYKIFIIDEPNILYTATEKTAIINFVKNGGGLFMIADHNISDRNNDGKDSPAILNDLMTNNTVQSNPFGLSFDIVNTGNFLSSNIANLPSDPILHGTAGNVTQVQWSAGTTITLNTTQNSSVKGLAYKTGASNTGLLNVLCASATYQSGKVVAIGDSSVPDDGTGDLGDTLYNGYTGDASGNHQKLLMNATIWLATSSLGVDDFNQTITSCSIAPNPISNKKLNLNYFLTASENEIVSITIFDSAGRVLKTENIVTNFIGLNSQTILLDELNASVYFCKVSNGNFNKTMSFVIN